MDSLLFDKQKQRPWIRPVCTGLNGVATLFAFICQKSHYFEFYTGAYDSGFAYSNLVWFLTAKFAPDTKYHDNFKTAALSTCFNLPVFRLPNYRSKPLRL